MPLFSTATSTVYESMLSHLRASDHACVESAGQGIASLLAETYQSVVLCRVFIVVPYAWLPLQERAHVPQRTKMAAASPVMSLLGTCGRMERWNDRRQSAAHRAFPTSSPAAPILSALLSGPYARAETWSEGPISVKDVAGHRAFMLQDAREARHESGRPMIEPSFVEAHGVRSIFGGLVRYSPAVSLVAITFTDEMLTPDDVERWLPVLVHLDDLTREMVGRGQVWA